MHCDRCNAILDDDDMWLCKACTFEEAKDILQEVRDDPTTNKYRKDKIKNLLGDRA